MNRSFLQIKTYAKINLFLDVINKREDNYHNLQTLFHSISLHDVLSMELIKSDNFDKNKSEKLIIKIDSNNKSIPLDENNLVHKAIKNLVNTYYSDNSYNLHFKIFIEKNIPPEGGLAGGSTNAAAALNLCNKMLNLNLNNKVLIDIASKLGADIPFCIKTGTAIGTGIGDKLEYLKDFPSLDFIIALPDFSVSTPWVFKNLDFNALKKAPKIEDTIISFRDKKEYILYNALETIVIPQFPQIKMIKDEFMRLGCNSCLMSGSGSTVLGILNKTSDFEYIYDNFNIPNINLIKSHSQNGDI